MVPLTQKPTAIPTPLRMEIEKRWSQQKKPEGKITRIPTVKPTLPEPDTLKGQIEPNSFVNPLISQGKITFNSYPPGAEVIVDGQIKGKTPITLESINPGLHQVEIKNSGYQQYKTSFQVQSGMQNGINPQMQINLKPVDTKKGKKPKVNIK